MEEEKGFYKLEPSNKGRPVLIHGRYLINKNYTLHISQKDTYTYPVDGWSYFDTFSGACTFFNVSEEDHRYYVFPSDDLEEDNIV
tara:strand:+ start:498 stop:752 length:255 start_codon:yes stop_codon:yes gene_type:complete